MKVILAGILLLIFFSNCSPSLNSWSPQKLYSREVLQQDFKQLQNTLQKKHPSLHWYTSPDSLEQTFLTLYKSIPDSMTEASFAWRIITPYVAAIHCGHTSVSYSKKYSKWAKEKRFSSFPLYMLAWSDSMVVSNNLIKSDTVFKRGTIIRSINGVPTETIRNRIFRHLPMDGYSENINYVRLSSSFPRYYGNEFGLSKKYIVEYVDSATGKSKKADIPVFEIKKDSLKKDSIKALRDSLSKREKPARITPLQKRERFRKMTIDSTGTYALMTLNSFTKGHIRSFFRRSFKEINKKKINHVIIDLRANGGGRLSLSTLLTKYVSRQPFRVADSVYTISKYLGKYKRNISSGLLIDIGLFFATRKGKDGNYHLRKLENRVYTPKTRNHFAGNLYILVNGASFSASTVFANAMKGQQKVTLVGEETGGGWYGNNGIFIPDLTLRNSGLRVRLPLFRLVQYNHIETKGTGIKPDVYVPVTYNNFMLRKDGKMEAVKQLIAEDQRIVN